MNNEGEQKVSTSSAALNFNNLDSMFDNMFSVQEETKPAVEQEEITKEEEKVLTDKKVENISNTNVDAIIAKLNNIENELNNEFVERSELVKIMILAIVTNSNLLMLGPPGTAKTKISLALCNRIDNSKFFQWLLNKSSSKDFILLNSVNVLLK